LAQLTVPLVPVETCEELASHVDSLLRQRKFAEATEAVDVVLQVENIGLSAAMQEQIRQARNQLFLRRRQHRRDAQEILWR
jgi:hypothetical protein